METVLRKMTLSDTSLDTDTKDKTAQAIQMEGVSKQYPIFDNVWQGMRHLVKTIRYGHVASYDEGRTVAALQNVNLSISRGERVGIIGRNGAGKSTLLKLLAGNLPPTSGSIFVNGKIYSILPGSINLSLELSICENARQHLSLLPLTPREIEAAIEEIREFTELGEYFTQPAMNLSSGMRMRAEFAIATACMSDIVIIDEVLGAGDIYWTEKIARRMEKLCERGITLILVSHSISQIARYCKRAIWIEHGKIILDGEVNEVTKRYESYLEKLSWHTNDLNDKSFVVNALVTNHGDVQLHDSGQIVTRWPGRGCVMISGVWINGEAVTQITTTHGQRLSFRIRLRAQNSGDFHLRYLITFWDTYGRRVAVLENDVDDVHIEAGTYHDVVVNCRKLILTSGNYHLSVAVIDAEMAASTTSESLTRMDVLYKSFHLHIKDSATSICPRPQPVYRYQIKHEILEHV